MKHKRPLIVIMMTLTFLTACGETAARYNNTGNREYDAENYTGAVDNYVAAQREDPDVAEPYYNAGNAYHRQGNFESAAAQTKQSVRISGGEVAQNSYYNLGNTYFKTEDWPAAIEAYKEALKLKPDDLDAKYNLELALKKLEEQQQQQQAGGGGQSQPDQNQGGGQNQQQPPQNEGQGEEPEQDQQNGGGQPEPDQSGQSDSEQQQDQQPQPGPRGLTPQEAEQLLDALGQDSQTLQERLQQGFFAPGRRPDKDW